MVEPPAAAGRAPGRNADGTWSKIDTSKYIWAREGGSGMQGRTELSDQRSITYCGKIISIIGISLSTLAK
jgi:hypothetical protein